MRQRQFRCAVLIGVWLVGALTGRAVLDVPVQIKESAGIGATNWPVLVTVPLPYGTYTNLETLVLRDADGTAVPAQFAVLDRWVGRDNSLRHITVQFQATVDAYLGPGTGTNRYRVCDDGPAVFPSPLSVSNQSEQVIVQTGPLKFTVDKTTFKLLDQVWLDANSNGVFEASECLLDATNSEGAVLTDWRGNIQRDALHTNLTVTVEESGPVRAVIRVSSPTVFTTTNDMTHGFAVRIYAYAEQPYIKLDYQLQNAALNVDLSWPLYFDSLNLDFGLTVTNTPEISLGLGSNGVWRAQTNAARLAQTFDHTCQVYGASSAPLQTLEASDGWLDVCDGTGGVGLFMRNFQTMWPNGLTYTNDGTLRVEFFPEWSCQFSARSNRYAKVFDSGHRYWLEDMQATYKEMLLYFHAQPLGTDTLKNVAAQFEFPPVPVIPLDWYRETAVTLDMEGIIPPGAPLDDDTSRHPGYIAFDWETDIHYRFGWDNYYLDEPGRKYGANTTGGWPSSSASRFIVVGNPLWYYDAERKAIAEMNIRPHWMPGYSHSNDWDRIRLTQNPYAAESWRRFNGNGLPYLAGKYLDETWLDTHPRDDQHGWFQHINDWYHISANPWIRDWYKFIAQFRRPTLMRTDPFPDISGRGRGHGLAHALAACRSTGDAEMLDLFAVEVQRLRNDQYRHGGRFDATKDGKPAGASWQGGYVSRAVLDYMNEIKGHRNRSWAEGFSFIAGLIDWNLNHANFSYYLNAFFETNKPSSNTGLIMIDMQAWYALNTGDTNAIHQIQEYLEGGINGGELPAGDFSSWKGQYECRTWALLTNALASDRPFESPAPITTFGATAETGRVVFNWEGMPGATRYHVCWSTNEISLQHTLSTNYINWWAAETTMTNITTTGGESLTLSVTSSIPAGTPLSACIFYFDTNRNMSVKTEIVRPPIAAFSGKPLRGAAPFTVDFTNETLGTLTSCRWAFGDGAISNTEHASHTFVAAGDYTVSLTVSNTVGGDTLVRSNYVHVVPTGMPIADFSWSTNRGQVPLTVQFTNLSIGSITSNLWQFGDGGGSTLADPSHNYTTVGVATVTLIAYTATGADTCRVTDCITILPPPPTAAFSAHPTSGGFPLTVTFTDETGGSVTNWQWAFGDGASSSEQHPVHDYATTGSYTVTLTVTGPGGSDTQTRSDYITVTPEAGDNFYIATGTDDAHEYLGNTVLDQSYIDLAYEPIMLSGFRFSSVRLPVSSVVTRAYIQFFSTSGQYEPATARIYGQKTATAATFSVGTSNISLRPRTAAYVDWVMPSWDYTAAGDDQRTPDLSGIIREIIAETLWTNGAPLVFIFTDGDGAGGGKRHPSTYEGAISQNDMDRIARLHIETQSGVDFSSFSLRAFALTNRVALRWTDPAQCGMSNWPIHIRVDTSTYPAALTAGTEVVTTNDTHYTELDVPPNVTRYYTLWLSPDGTNWLEPDSRIIITP